METQNKSLEEMAARAGGIEWTGPTWNPLAGCTRHSPGCGTGSLGGCYAEKLHDKRHAMYVKNGGKYPRTGKPIPVQYAKPFSEIQLLHDRLEKPKHWRVPQLIFVNSMSDLFHKNVPTSFILEVLKVMDETPQHTYQVLTKRAERLPEIRSVRAWPANLHLGVSVEDRKRLARIPFLVNAAPAVAWLSVEPLLEDLGAIDLNGIQWVVVGGETAASGSARPLHPDWARRILAQCAAASVPFFFKQWGNMMHESQIPAGVSVAGKRHTHVWPDGSKSYHVDKNVAGRLLDGQLWNQFPRIVS
jgi:protein gp37